MQITGVSHHKIKDPIRGCSNGSTLRTHAQAVNLGGIQPRYALHADAEENVVQEKECHRPRSDFLLIRVAGFLGVADQDRDDEVAEALPAAGEDHHVAPAPTLNVGNANQREEQVGDRVAGSEEAS